MHHEEIYYKNGLSTKVFCKLGKDIVFKLRARHIFENETKTKEAKQKEEEKPENKKHDVEGGVIDEDRSAHLVNMAESIVDDI